MGLPEDPDEVIGLHAEVKGDILHGTLRVLGQHLHGALQPQVLQIFMRSDAVFLQEQTLEMLDGITDSRRQIGDQQRFGEMLVDQTDCFIKRIVTDILVLQPGRRTCGDFTLRSISSSRYSVTDNSCIGCSS